MSPITHESVLACRGRRMPGSSWRVLCNRAHGGVDEIVTAGKDVSTAR
jgi:hypothetical protein